MAVSYRLLPAAYASPDQRLRLVATCDTATTEAIALGVRAGASGIVPCPAAGTTS